MLVFCQVHVLRNFQKKFRGHEITHQARMVWESTDNLTELKQHMLSIVKNNPELESWYKGKDVQWILAGLSSTATFIEKKWWRLARKDTNIAESSHHQDNFWAGKGTTLLGSVLK